MICGQVSFDYFEYIIYAIHIQDGNGIKTGYAFDLNITHFG